MQKIIKKLIPFLVLVLLVIPSISSASLTITTQPAVILSNIKARLQAQVILTPTPNPPPNTSANVKFKYTTSTLGNSCNSLPGATEVQGSPIINFGTSGTFSVTVEVTGLVPGTAYRYCAYDNTTDPFNPVYGGIVPFVMTGPPPPPPGSLGTAETGISFDVGLNTATVRGFVTFPSGFTGSNSAWFRYSATNPGTCNNTFGTSTSYETVSPTHNISDVVLTGLLENTTYYYCAIVGNSTFGPSSTAFSFGSIMSFKTKASSGGTYVPPPTITGLVGEVITMPVKSPTLTDTEVLFEGKLVAGSGTIYGYFRYSAVEVPPIFCNEVFGSDMRSVTANVPHESGLVEPGNFYALVDDLEPDTQYAFCAVVSNHGKSSNKAKIRYGEPVVFHTLPCQDCPHTTVETNPAVIIDSTSASLKGKYGSTKYTKTHFEYQEIPDDQTIPLGDWISTDISENTPGYRKMNFTLTDLKPFTTYNFKAIATTNTPDEVFEGLELSFKTPKFSYGTFGLGEEIDPGVTDDTSSCFDGIQNGNETDIDTGAECGNSDGLCDAGYTGTPPNCVLDVTPLTCGIGFTGTPPDCVADTFTCEDLGMTGTQPNCEIPAQTCADLGLTGTFPDCKFTCENIGLEDVVPATDPPTCVQPTLSCVGLGLEEVLPATNPPTCKTPTQDCASLGLTEVVPATNPPSCKVPSQSCSSLGLVEVSPATNPPSCKQPDPTCENLGMTGTYPSCSTEVTACQQMGMAGIWPDCINVGDGVGDPGDDGNQGDDGNGNNGNGNGNGNGNNGNGNGNGNGNNGNGNGNGCANDKDCGGIPDDLDSDIDGDGVPNVIDPDTDGDGTPNSTDPDDDGDGIPDLVDISPTGRGTIHDYDGSGIRNNLDSDMDGDGIPNACDPDTDGDGILNKNDPDMDSDGIPNDYDPTPTGASGGTCPVLGVGDKATPSSEDIVRYHEGIEHVFARRIVRSVPLQVRYGYQSGSNLTVFAYDLAHTLAKTFGYVDKSGKEIRVSKKDVSAYSLRISGNKLYVYEYYKNKIIDVRIIKNNVRVFKTKNPYEYYFKKKF